MEIDVKITKKYSGGCRASVNVEFPEGGFSVNQIHVRDVKGRPRITFPLSKHQHPYITLRGELKQTICAAVEEAFFAARTG